ncbi:MFS transporter [Variovorax paradoxus]|uniref:MFS transporter n=1 Tax=Variovorax paradoxus TaxID=34073 RepID=UPI003ECD522B
MPAGRADPLGHRLGWQIARSIAGQVCLHAAMAGARLTTALLALSQGYSKTAVGALVAQFALMQVFLALPAGRFADRNGLKRPITYSVIAAITGLCLAAAWPTYPVLCLCALLCGGATGAAAIALQRHVGRLAQTPAQRRTVFTWVATAPAMAIVIGPAAAGFIIDHAGFRAAFLIMAPWPIAAWLLSRMATEGATGGTGAKPAGTTWDLLRAPYMSVLLLMNLFMSISWELHAFMVPVLGHERGLHASQIGTILACCATGVAAVRIAVPLFAAHLAEWLLITLAVAFAGVLIMAYPFAPSTLAMCVGSALIGMTLGCVQPMVLSMLHQITPADRQGEALAIRMMTVNASAVTIPIVLGAVTAISGPAGVFWAMGMVTLVGSTLGRRLRCAPRHG